MALTVACCALPGVCPLLSGMQVGGTGKKHPWEDVELGPLIGQGSFGKVYRGVWNGAPVAVKVGDLSLLLNTLGFRPCGPALCQVFVGCLHRDVLGFPGASSRLEHRTQGLRMCRSSTWQMTPL